MNDEQSKHRRPKHEHVERPFELERLVFFSDAVFAIAVTLLAIELRLPELATQTSEALVQAVFEEWPHFLAFALGFWFVALYWTIHHRYFKYIIEYDTGLVGRNLLILFFVALMPFTTNLLGEYGNIAAGVWFYCANIIALGLCFAMLWRHATNGHRLVEPDLDDNFIRYMLARGLATPLTAFIVFLLSLVVQSAAANFAWFLIYFFQYVLRRRFHMPASSGL